MNKVLRLGFACLALTATLVLPAQRAEANNRCSSLSWVIPGGAQNCQEMCASYDCSGYNYNLRSGECHCTHP